MASEIKGVPVSPLTGILDARSIPDQMSSGSLRMRQNMQTVAQNKLVRGSGWSKLLSQPNYNNADFHDQLLSITSGTTREPITLLFETKSTRRVRSLFLGTHSRIAVLNEFSGNYRILGSGFGGTSSVKASAARFKAAQLGDYVVFTNDIDKPQYHLLEQNGVDSTAPLNSFPDLDTIGLSRAALVWSWNNVLIFADVEMDQQRYGYRLIWSDFDAPLGFDPADPASITGKKDLYTHERILAGAPSGNSFLIYTTHGIWEMVVVGGDQSFAFRRVYDAENKKGVGVLKYPNTLVNLGKSHMYCAEDGIYTFNLYGGEPIRDEWLHRASSILYDDINAAACTSHVAGYSSKNEVLISMATMAAENDCPDITLRIQIPYSVVDKVDFGFTAFCSHQSYVVPTIRDFIITSGICDIPTLRDAGYGWVNEGLPRPLPSSTAPFTPSCIYTKTPQTIDGQDVEDWNQPTADPDSLCTLLGDLRLDDICRACEGTTLFIGAASTDWALKEIGSVFYRERCVNVTAVGVTSEDGYTSAIGSYSLDGYESILLFAPMFTNNPDDPMIQMDQLRLNFDAVPQNPPSEIGLRIGISASPEDANSDTRKIVWFQHSLKALEVLTTKTLEEHIRDNTIPSEFMHWNVFRKGRVLYVELKIPGTGGESAFSNIRADVKTDPTVNY